MTKEARIYNGEKTASLINTVGKTEQLHAKESNWTTFSHHIKKKKKAKMDQRPKYKTPNHKTPGKECSVRTAYDVNHNNFFFCICLLSQKK